MHRTPKREESRQLKIMRNFFGDFWNYKKYEEKQWFRLLAIGLISTVILYLLLHLLPVASNNSFEYTKLSAIEMQQINRIYFDSIRKADTGTTDVLSPSPTDAGKERTPTQPNDTPKTDSPPSHVNNGIEQALQDQHSIDLKYHINCDSLTRAERVLQYLKNEFDGIDKDQLLEIEKYLCCATPTEATGFLLNVKLKVSSCFWLDGSLVYFEIIFWTLFGVFCNLVFNLGLVAKGSDPKDAATFFDPNEIPNQIAKLLYAPICTIIIVFGYNMFNSASLADIYLGKGVLIFGFIGGYYSSRLISFLDRLKDLLLPNSATNDRPAEKPIPVKNMLLNVSVAALPPLQANELPDPINSASVKVVNSQTNEVLNAVNVKGHASLFMLDFVKAGTYNIEALLKVKDINTGLYINRELKENMPAVEMKNEDLYIKIELK